MHGDETVATRTDRQLSSAKPPFYVDGAISSEKCEVSVRVMISLVRFQIGVLIQVPGVFPRAVQLLQAGSLLLCSLE